ncbi:MAG TPA: hypothetical protein VMU87_19330 [Stellaceae bacterium]|nr:hypothetical protein [Stellaceae bacterium]
MAKPAVDQPATGHEIVEILGPLDDAVLAAILRTDATRNEVMEAYVWLSADDQLRRERHSTIRGKAAEVCRILEAELPPSPDER